MTKGPDDPPDERTRTTADELGSLLPALRRAAVRATRAQGGLPTLAEAQVALLRALAADPLPPAQIAQRLGWARPTVSNLVRDLVVAGLVDRERSSADGRSVTLALTPRAREVLTTFRAGHGRVMARAVAGLPADERDRLAAALPALRSLLTALASQRQS